MSFFDNFKLLLETDMMGQTFILGIIKAQHHAYMFSTCYLAAALQPEAVSKRP